MYGHPSAFQLCDELVCPMRKRTLWSSRESGKEGGVDRTNCPRKQDPGLKPQVGCPCYALVFL